MITDQISLRGVRGAITVDSNSTDAMLEATTELLAAIIEKNNIDVSDVASILFTVTPDLNATFPALAARNMGYTLVPLMCISEIPVPNSLPLTIRVLIHWNTFNSQKDIHHIYLKEAISLRPDLSR